jgi:hypothetical protein
MEKTTVLQDAKRSPVEANGRWTFGRWQARAKFWTVCDATI